MVVFKSSNIRGLFEHGEKVFHLAPEKKKSGQEKSRDLGGQMVVDRILSANKPSKSFVDISAV